MFRKRFAGCTALLSLLLCLASCQRQESSESDSAVTSRQQTQALRSLPYAGWVPVDEEGEKNSGVAVHEASRVFAGLNLLTPRDTASAYLLDMSGAVKQSWSVAGRTTSWLHVELAVGSDLLVIEKDRNLLRIDWDSEVRWIRRGRFHHDVAEATTGEIYATSRRERIVRIGDVEVPILDDLIEELTADGRLLRRLSLFDLFGDRLSDERAAGLRKWADENGIETAMAERTGDEIVIADSSPGDVFHLNSIEILDREIAGVGRPGDLLISLRNINTIAIIDVDAEKVMWTWGAGELEWQHHPTLLKTGNILVFDNGVRRKFTRVLEVEPCQKTIVWEYRGDPPEAFFSLSRGASQRLPNGNTLITESDNGRVFEIDADGQIVWDYYLPLTRQTKQGKQRSALYRMERIVDPERLGIAPVS